MHMTKILAAIPTFNERSHVQGVVAAVRAYVPDVLVVDDGSTDGTTELLDHIPGIQKIVHRQNRGYGSALVSAFRHAIDNRYDWIITIDCDRQHEPESIIDFLRLIEHDDADIISGSRYLQPAEPTGAPPPDRRRINQLITRMLNDKLSLTLTDAFCGFKGYRTSALEKLCIDVPGYAMPLQLWVQAADLALRIREIPVSLVYIDTARQFGDGLDDPDSRLEYYLSVIDTELSRRPDLQIPAREGQLPPVVCP